MTIKIVCEECGSDQIVVDANAEWDISLQEWVTTGVLDEAHCFKCDDSCPGVGGDGIGGASRVRCGGKRSEGGP